MDGGENRIGGFRVLKSLKAGAGSQGTVYKAVAERQRFDSVPVGSVVALKVMVVQDEDGSQYARLEKRTAELVSLDHPNIVRYYGCFREKGVFTDLHVIVLQYLEGESLKASLAHAKTGLDADRALKIAGGVLKALAYTSCRGIVHRDLKPGNIILTAEDEPKLIDFEVSRRTDGTMTSSGGNMIGTFDYMAPDFTDPNFRGDTRSDIFSFGVCLHEILSGTTPYRRFSGESSQANFAFLQRWVKAGSSENPIRISSRLEKLTDGAVEVVARMLAPNREDRYQSFDEVSEALKHIRYRELRHGGNAWRMLRYIGKGGCGEVFQARDRKTGALVAVKRLLQPGYAERFRREAKILARLDDSCFTRFVDFVPPASVGSSAYLVMECLPDMPGGSLRDAIKAASPMALDRAAVLTAFIRYAHGLAVLHEQGVIHRDIKPSNLYFPKTAPQRAVIMDMGIVRDVSGTATTGAVPGTIDYMPPESVLSTQRGDACTDIWALGLCLYEALTGTSAYPRLPEGQTGYTAFFRRVQNAERPDLSKLKGDVELFALVSEMCEIDPVRRLRDAREVERRLQGICGRNVPDAGREDAAGFVLDAGVEPDDGELSENMTLETQIVSQEARQFLGQIQLREESATSPVPVLRVMVIMLTVVALTAAGWFGWRQYQGLVTERQRLAAEEQRLATRERQRQEEAKRKAEEDEKRRAEEAESRRQEEAKRKAEDEKRRAEEAKVRLQEEAKRRAEDEKRQAEAAEMRRREEARRKAEAELKRQEELKRQAEEKESRRQEELKRQTEAAESRRREEARRKAESEAKRQEELKRQAEAAEKEKRQAEAEKRRIAEEDRQSQWDQRFRKAKSQFESYEKTYWAKMENALRPGSIVSPEEIQSLQQEYIERRRTFRALQKQYESRHGGGNTLSR